MKGENVESICLTLFVVLFSFCLSAQDARSTIPSDDEVKTALATVKDVFKEEYKKLKTPDDRKALAKKLLEQAADTKNTPAMIYVLIAESARIAGEAGDIATIVEASDLYVQKFEGDDIAARWNMLEAAEKAAPKPSPESLSLLAEEYLKLADGAMAADDFKNATELARNAERVATKTKNKTLAANATGKKKEVADAMNSLKNVSISIDKLETNPDDPDANFAVGKYTCLTKGDFDKGLPMLAKSSDKDYKEAAELELAAKDTASTMKSADKWWDLADKEKSKPAKDAVKAHAASLYEKVLPELSGIEKVKLEKRMTLSPANNSVKAISEKWITPMGGKVEIKNRDVILSGSGRGDAGNAIAILDQALPKNCKITGELKRKGRFSGFAFGYNSEEKTFWDVYSEGNKGVSTVFSHDNLTRKVISLSNNLAFPSEDTYVKFTINISPKNITFQIDKSKCTIEIPRGMNGDRFGIMIYEGSTMQIRNLSIK